MMWRSLSAIKTGLALLALVVAPATAQPFPTDAESLRIINEMDLTRFVTWVLAALFCGALGMMWRSLSAIKSALAAAQAQAASDALARAAEEAADRREREGYLGLLWAMQGTMVQSKEAILASNTGYQAQVDAVKAQVDAVKAHTSALNDHTEEAKKFRSALSTEMLGIRQAVDGGYDKVGAMVKDGIAEGMKAAAGVFAGELKPIHEQLVKMATLLETKGNDDAHAQNTDAARGARPADSAGPHDGGGAGDGRADIPDQHSGGDAAAGRDAGDHNSVAAG